MRYAIWLLVAFVIGCLLGPGIAGEPPPEVIEVPKTEVIREPAPPPVEVPTVPESCLLALSYAKTIDREGSNLYDKGDENLELISDAREALASSVALSGVEEDVRSLQSSTVDNLFTLSQALTRFESAYNDCQKELQ